MQPRAGATADPVGGFGAGRQSALYGGEGGSGKRATTQLEVSGSVGLDARGRARVRHAGVQVGSYGLGVSFHRGGGEQRDEDGSGGSAPR